MWAIGSVLRRRWVEIAWAIFALVNVLVLLSITGWETIPFHFVWVSLTIVYGIRLWRLRDDDGRARRRGRGDGLGAVPGGRASAGGPGLDETDRGPAHGRDVPRDGLARGARAEGDRQRAAAAGTPGRLRARRVARAEDPDHRGAGPHGADPRGGDHAAGHGGRGHRPRRAGPALARLGAPAGAGRRRAPRLPASGRHPRRTVPLAHGTEMERYGLPNLVRHLARARLGAGRPRAARARARLADRERGAVHRRAGRGARAGASGSATGS